MRRPTQLAPQALQIEQHYGCPMDIEWGKDGETGQHLHPAGAARRRCRAARGRRCSASRCAAGHACWPKVAAIGQRIGAGRARVIASVKRHCPRAAGRCAGRRHDGSGLGAGDEARGGHRDESRWQNLPCSDHRAGAWRAGGGGLRRRDADDSGRHGGDGVLRRRRHRACVRGHPFLRRAESGAAGAARRRP